MLPSPLAGYTLAEVRFCWEQGQSFRGSRTASVCSTLGLFPRPPNHKRGQFIDTNNAHAGTAHPACYPAHSMPCTSPAQACENQTGVVSFFLRAHHAVDQLTKPCKKLWTLEEASQAYAYEPDFCATTIVWGTWPICKDEGETGACVFVLVRDVFVFGRKGEYDMSMRPSRVVLPSIRSCPSFHFRPIHEYYTHRMRDRHHDAALRQRGPARPDACARHRRPHAIPHHLLRAHRGMWDHARALHLRLGHGAVREPHHGGPPRLWPVYMAESAPHRAAVPLTALGADPRRLRPLPQRAALPHPVPTLRLRLRSVHRRQHCACPPRVYARASSAALTHHHDRKTPAPSTPPAKPTPPTTCAARRRRPLAPRAAN